jgi:uncharacterized cupredoxin-like copper-binding protein
MDEIIPPWFWKLAAVCTFGGTITLVTTAWSLGSFMSETQTWQKAQDERFFEHLDNEKEARREIINAIGDIRKTVRRNQETGTVFVERQGMLFDDIHTIRKQLNALNGEQGDSQ